MLSIPLTGGLPALKTFKAIRLFPVQQPLLPFKFTDLGQVLADFKTSAVVSVGIPHCKIADIDEFVPQFDPEFGRVPGTGFEGIQDLVDQMDTFGRVAVSNLPADDRGLRGNMRSGPSE